MSSKSLNGLNVLVTRPALQQESLQSSIEIQGGIASSFPLIEIEPLREKLFLESLEVKISSLGQYHCLIFLSVNAGVYGTRLINDYWPRLPAGIEVIAIGATTAQVVSKGLACQAIYSKAGSSSEDLLLLPQLLNVKQRKIAIVRGLGGRELLANTLRHRGAQVDYLEVYRRNPIKQSAAHLLQVMQKFKVNVVSITSGDSLERLNRLFLEDKNRPQKWHSIPVIVPSKRIFNIAQQFGFKNIRLAKGADVESTILALEELAIEVDKLDSSKWYN
ncbi:MAG: uroporphyrinogen-III synthase [Gammaproteobacteria bacterium]|nr:uroporphyrinogen-III synthase [Gammaproteobacteria bacterium]